MASNKIVINDNVAYEVPDKSIGMVEDLLKLVCTAAMGVGADGSVNISAGTTDEACDCGDAAACDPVTQGSAPVQATKGGDPVR